MGFGSLGVHWVHVCVCVCIGADEPAKMYFGPFAIFFFFAWMCARYIPTYIVDVAMQ